MGFFDRFRSQPRWRHADASVRLEAVRELASEDQDVLVALAREDDDPRVRLAAVRRLSDPQALGDVARGDSDQGVREAAQSALLDLAMGEAAEAAEAAVDQLTEPRLLTMVVRSAGAATIRRRAAERVTDPKGLVSVAVLAPDEALRLEALGRLSDPQDLVAVALRSDGKEVAFGALERLNDPEHLESIAARARHKGVARRARARLTALEEEASAREAARLRLMELCRQAEDLLTQPDPLRAFERMLTLQQTWRTITPTDEHLAGRFETACVAVQARRHQFDLEEADRQEHLRVRQQSIAARAALCEAVERLTPQSVLLEAARQDAEGSAAGVRPLREAAADVLRRLREDWNVAGEIEGDDARTLEARFAAACATLTRRCTAWEAAQATEGELVRICAAMEQLAEAASADAGTAASGNALADGADRQSRPAELRRQWGVLITEAARLARDAGLGSAFEAHAARFEAAEARLRAREAEEREARARQQRDEAARAERQIEALEAVAGRNDLSLKEAERASRDARQVLDAVRTAAAGQRAFEPLVSRAKAVHNAIYPRVQELRELDEWKRWANLGVQEDLCGRIEALVEAKDLPWVAKQLRQIETEWKEASDAPADRAAPLRQRFHAAHDQVRARCESFFLRQAEQRAENLRQKVAICERAESLADSTDWIRTAEAFKLLQKEWQQIGGLRQQEAQALWHRFRAACDRFFQRRHEDLARRKESWAANLAAKQALCEQAETLAESTDWSQALAAIKRLQAQWKTVGPVRKNKSEAIWQRFRAACDRFFERYAHRDQSQLTARLAARETLCQEVEQWVSGLAQPEAAVPEDLAERVRDVRRRWLAAGELPRARHEALQERLDRAIAALAERAPERFRGTDLDPDATRRRMEKLCARMEGLLVEVSQPDRTGSPAEVLARQLRERLAANTIAGAAATPSPPKRPSVPDLVREAQSAWRRLGPVPGEEGRALSARFEEACRRVLDTHRRQSNPQPESSRDRSPAHASQPDSSS